MKFFSTSSSSSSQSAISSKDIDHMREALRTAKLGYGCTFPNPAVGCVLVDQNSDEILGAGFHPRAGYPHAEVFALFQAAGHVESGIEAAKSVVEAYEETKRKQQQSIHTLASEKLFIKVQQLTEQYSLPGGPEDLFAPQQFANIPMSSVTAYVTLEPCCHTGKTPPCAVSLVAAGIVSRVVVGFRDPNPRVDGGGVKLLQEAGIDVDMLQASQAEDELKVHAQQTHQACAELVSDFVKRISPKVQADDSYITGAMRRSLRSHAGRLKSDSSLVQIDWTGSSLDTGDDDWEASILELPVEPSWLERVDHDLWKHELLLLRLNKAIKKNKGVKILGARIAEQLQAHVAQTVGHTVLLYRPGIPPVLDLEALGSTSVREDGDDT